MELWLWAVIGILTGVSLSLFLKIHLMHRAAREIAAAFAAKTETDTNTLIDMPGRDREMRRLTIEVNKRLAILRARTLRYMRGDLELKDAVTNISHDLRTPLTAINGYLDLLERMELPEDAARYLAVIRNRTEAMGQLTEELFRYSVILNAGEELQMMTVTVNDVLEQSIAAFYTALREKGITPDIRITERKVVRTLDPSALSRIFSNLIGNAVKYSGGDLEIGLGPDGGMWFANTAAGLSEVEVGRLFDRFYTVENARRSTGLGLSIARTLTERMGGTLTASYSDGRLLLCLVFPDDEEQARSL